MKTRFLILLALSVTTIFGVGIIEARNIERPICVATNTPYEGWMFPGKHEIHSANCSNKVMECSGIGTRSEGWYVFEKQNIALLQYASCNYEIVSPACVFVGTPDEAWVVPARGLRIYFGKCEGKGVECSDKNYAPEGWYIFDKKPLGLYMYSNCSKEE
jgi:hypothetical protein